MNSDLITIKQLPVIEERLHELKDDITSRVNDALLLDCNENTRKQVKAVRADLRKELSEYEKARMSVKKAISEPYEKFNQVYKECVSGVFNSADAQLKAKIDKVEDDLKEQKRKEILSYANELKAAFAIDWLNVERIMPNVTLSSSASVLKQKVADEIERIDNEVHVIIDDPELFAEYQKTLNLAQSQLIVKQRRAEIEKVKAESERKAQQEEIKQEVIEKVEMIAPPVVVQEEIFEMTFTATGTLKQLKALKAFMLDNDIKF